MDEQTRLLLEKRQALAKATALNKVDRTTGAPSSVRRQVGAARTPEDRLANIQKFYPDAQPAEDGNFIYTDPETGQKTLYNEENPTILGVPYPTAGDLSSLAPELAQTAGGVIGGFLATPTSPLGIAAGVGLGATAGQELLDLYDINVGDRIDTRNAPTRMIQAATVGGENAIGQRVGELVSKAPGAVSGLIRKHVAGDPAQAAKTAGALSRSGITPITPLVTPDRGITAAYNTLGNMPTSSPGIRKQINTALDEATAASERIAARYGRVKSKEQAGNVLIRGAKEGAETFAKRGGQLYDQLDNYILPDDLVEVPNTLGTLKHYKTKFGENQDVVNLLEPSIYNQWEAAFSNGQPLTYGMIKALRTDLRQRLGQPGAYASDDYMAYERIYKSLTDDMKEMAVEYGGREGLAVWNRANTYWRNFRGLTKSTLDNLVGKNAEPAKAWADAMNGSKDGIAKLRRIKATIGEEDWNQLASWKIREMGIPPAGQQVATSAAEAAAGTSSQFSPATFLKKFKDLDDRAKDTMFGGANSELRRALDDLLASSEAFKAASSTVNYSNTAITSFWMDALTGTPLMAALLGGAAGHAGSGAAAGATMLAAKGVIPHLSMRLLTSPKFVRWLTQGQRIPADNMRAMSSHMGRLLAIGLNNEELEPAINAYVTALRGN
jgi:hypothetical protein